MKNLNVVLFVVFASFCALPALGAVSSSHWTCSTRDELHRNFPGTGSTRFEAEESSFRSCVTFHYGATAFCHKPPFCELTRTDTVYFCAVTDDSGRRFQGSSVSQSAAETDARSACLNHHYRASWKCPSQVSCTAPRFEPAPVPSERAERGRSYDLRGTDVEGQRFLRRFRRFQTTPSGTELGSDF